MENGVLFERGKFLFDENDGKDNLFFFERSKSQEHNVFERSKNYNMSDFEKSQKLKKNKENQRWFENSEGQSINLTFFDL